MKKFLNYKFLMTVLAGVVVLLEILKDVFKINLNIEAVISVSIAIIGVMVAIGIVNKDKTDVEVKSREDLKFYNDKINNEDKTFLENIDAKDKKSETKDEELKQMDLDDFDNVNTK